jgi:hypothetical protein
MSHRNVAAFTALLLVPGVWVACGGASEPSEQADAGSDGGLVDGSVADGAPVDGNMPDVRAVDGGAPADSGVVPDAAVSAPACTADGGFPRAAAVPAYGSFTGPELRGDVCAGGAFALLEHASGSSSVPGQLLFILDTALSGAPASFMRFAVPADATEGELTIFAGVSAAAPGVYPSSSGCGQVALCVYLPIPASVDCGDAGAPTSCPPGCSLEGAIDDLTCMPTTPENCYTANGSGDCVGGAQTPQGASTLTLTSVVPFDGADGGPGSDFVVHGTFTTTMVGDDAGLGTATMTLDF